MRYSLLDLIPNQGRFTSTSPPGVTFINNALNPGPNIRVYFHADVRVTDATPRICGIHLISAADGTHAIEVAVPRSISAAGAIPVDRVSVLRPIVVFPGERIRGVAEGMSTGASIIIVSAFVEIPLNQTFRMGLADSSPASHAYNFLELTPTGETAGPLASNQVGLPVNPGPNMRIYTYVDVEHDDPTPRIAAIQFLTEGSRVSVSEDRLVSSSESVAIQRPVVVPPGDQLFGVLDDLSTGASVTVHSTFIEVPQGQTIDQVF